MIDSIPQRELEESGVYLSLQEEMKTALGKQEVTIYKIITIRRGG